MKMSLNDTQKHITCVSEMFIVECNSIDLQKSSKGGKEHSSPLKVEKYIYHIIRI